jgi:HD superfamily phosphohydrolases
MANITMLPREKVFRDPVHNYIHVQHKVILDLINTKEFQRLRRVKQLGTSSFTFQGAEHTRFTHCMGVYEITRQICDNFQRNYPTKTPNDGLWNDDERLVALCAALLHDVGHGPYSHTFEHIFDTDHEMWTQKIITSKETEINQVLRQVSDDFPEKVASVISKTYPNPQVVQMISSQIDADRMDYLLRDAYFTGTKYGMFDLTRILRVMRPYQGGIAFDNDGMHAVEDYVLCRFQMYQQVYFHPVSRGMEVVLTKLLQRAKDLYEHNQMNGLKCLVY